MSDLSEYRRNCCASASDAYKAIDIGPDNGKKKGIYKDIEINIKVTIKVTVCLEVLLRDVYFVFLSLSHKIRFNNFCLLNIPGA